MDKENQMQLNKLDNSFYADHAHLVEVLDNQGGSWAANKVRGYGMVVISINSLTFAIPLRSNIRHTASYITVKGSKPGIKGKGLDFSKAVLISDPGYISGELFKISAAEHKKLTDKEHYITRRFESYVEKYIAAVKAADGNILGHYDYRFTTLINYHAELGLL